MIIKVDISEETWARMLTGRKVEGSIGYDKWTGKKEFRAFNRKTRSRLRDKLIKKLPWGWVKESKERIKLYESIPKEFGVMKVLETLNEEYETATEAIVSNDIIERA